MGDDCCARYPGRFRARLAGTGAGCARTELRHGITAFITSYPTSVYVLMPEEPNDAGDARYQ